MSKICTKCNIARPLKDFHKQKTGKFGVQSICKLCKKSYYEKSREIQIARSLAYRKNNKEKILERQRIYRTHKRLSDPTFKLITNLRIRLNKAMHRNSKSGSAVKDLGCSIPELKAHLESQFKPGMSWENYGEWHIDHIKPLASFDLTNREELLKACNYTNLQPLWAHENLKKGAR